MLIVSSLKKEALYPKFKKRNGKGSFTSINNTALLEKHVKLPKLGLVRYRGGLCPEGKIKKFTISESAGKYYASILFDMDIKRATM